MRRSRRPRRSSPTPLRGRESRCVSASACLSFFVFADQLSAARYWGYGNGAPASDLLDLLPPEKQVRPANLMSSARQALRKGPPDVPVHAGNKYSPSCIMILVSSNKTAPLATALLKDLVMSRRCYLTYPELPRPLVACRISRFRSESSM